QLEAEVQPVDPPQPAGEVQLYGQLHREVVFPHQLAEGVRLSDPHQLVGVGVPQSGQPHRVAEVSQAFQLQLEEEALPLDLQQALVVVAQQLFDLPPQLVRQPELLQAQQAEASQR